MSLADRLGVPAVHLGASSGAATILYTVDVQHLPCILQGLAHLEQDHGVFRIPAALPPDVSRLEGGEIS